MFSASVSPKSVDLDAISTFQVMNLQKNLKKGVLA